MPPPSSSRIIIGPRQKIIEPIVSRRVQLNVGRTKKIIASLLPVLLLVVLAHGPVESSVFASPNNGCVPCGSAEGAAPLPENSCCLLDQIARCELRRQAVERLPVACRNLEPVSNHQPIPLRSFSPAIPLAGEACLLQQRWQFVWRTADSPRAPSFLA